MDRHEFINKIRLGVKTKDPKAEVYLFGSRARGDNHQDSDWDILILVDDNKVSMDIEDKFRDDLFDLELETGQVISTLIYPKKYWQETLIYSPLYESVNQEGIRL